MDKEYEFCLRCGRKLKNPEARKTGFGMVCKRKMEVNARKNLIDLYYSTAYNKDVGSYYPGRKT